MAESFPITSYEISDRWLLTKPTAEYFGRIEAGQCPLCGADVERRDDGWVQCPNRGPHRIKFRLRPIEEGDLGKMAVRGDTVIEYQGVIFYGGAGTLTKLSDG